MKSLHYILITLLLLPLTGMSSEAKKTIIEGTWISKRGAEYIFKHDSMVCSHVPKEVSLNLEKWLGVTRLKEIKLVGDKYSALQAYRDPSDFHNPTWIKATIIFSGNNQFLITYQDREHTSTFTRKQN